MPTRRTATATGVVAVLFVLWLVSGRSGASRSQREHPLPGLLRNAQRQHDLLVSTRPTSLSDAYTRYISKHNGRLPPKKYDQWFWTSLRHDVCNLDRFDRMYDDLQVWRGISGDAINLRTETLRNVGALGRVRIRKGKVVPFAQMTKSARGHDSDARSAIELMISNLTDVWHLDLPDVDMFINGLDESRVVLPYEDKQEYLAKAKSGRLHGLQLPRVHFEELRDDAGESAWSRIRHACPPQSSARTAAVSKHPGQSPVVSHKYTSRFQTRLGHFLSDPDLERSSWCDQPDLQDLHGMYIRPLSWSVSDELWPVFSNSKISGYSDMLVPAWFYWNDWTPYIEKTDFDWVQKRDKLYWRGSNTGGKSFGLNWIGWQRSRLVSRTNRPKEWNHYDEVLLSLPSKSPAVAEIAQPLVLPSHALNNLTDIAFSGPDVHGDRDSIASQRREPSFRFSGFVSFALSYSAKAILDMDGTAYSGRFLALMSSRSAVFKQRLFEEALGDTLVPWYHYVPLSVRANELYNLLVYFLGAPKHEDPASAKRRSGNSDLKLTRADHARLDRTITHEKELKAIADNGAKWARECARKEDMLSYLALLILEWGRLTGDDKDRDAGLLL